VAENENPSLREAMEQAYTQTQESPPAVEAPVSPPAEVPPTDPSDAPPAATPSPDQGTPRDASGRFVPKDPAAPPVEKETGGKTVGETVETGLTPPLNPAAKDPTASWSAGDREMFKTLPEAGQKFLLRRHADMERGFTQKTQAIAALKEYEPVAEMFRPYEHQLRVQGLTAAQVIGKWASAEQMLQQNPGAALQQLGRMYGVEVQIGGQERPAKAEQASWLDADPKIRQLEAAVQQSQAFIAEQQQRHNEAQIQQFAEGKDSSGKLLRPYIENPNVVAEMVASVHGWRAAGRQPDLQKIYEIACWSVPEVRDEIDAARRDAERRDAERQAREKAAAAAKAGVSVGSGAPIPGQDSPAQHRDVRKTVADAWDHVHR
jgi:hypothetical protein